jgi:hypothetical protein
VGRSLSLVAIAKQGNISFNPNSWKWETSGNITFTSDGHTATVTFTAPGSVTVTATTLRTVPKLNDSGDESYSGASYTWSFDVPVPDTTVTSVTVQGTNETTASIKKKNSITVTAAVTIDGAPTTNLAAGALTWSVPEEYFNWNYVEGKGNVITLTPKKYVTEDIISSIQAKHKEDTPITFTLTLLKPEVAVAVAVQQGSSTSLTVGETANLEAVVTFDSDAVSNDIVTIAWHSSNTAVVSFENEGARSAEIKALTAGTSTVWATVPDWSNEKSNELSVTVSAVHIPDTTVTGITATVTSMKTKETVTLTAAVTIDGAPTTNLAVGTLTWSVPGEYYNWNYVEGKGNVISLTPKKYVTANVISSIRAKHKEDTPETFTLTLLKPEIEVAVSSQNSTSSLHVGDTRNLDAVVTFDDDAVQNDVATLDWHSSNTAVVSFENEGTRSAEIKALTAGTSTVWATVPDWSNKKSNELSVTVLAAPDTTVTAVTATVNEVTVSTASIKKKETIILTAAVTIDGAPTTNLATGALTWSVPEEYYNWNYVEGKGNVISLTPKKYVTANVISSIRAKHKEDDPETFTLTLLKPEIEVAVSSQNSTSSLHVGDTRNLDAVVAFDDDAVSNDIATIVWHSSNTAVVSFENEGTRSAEIKALTAGTSTVWATVPDWSNEKSNELSVTVSTEVPGEEPEEELIIPDNARVVILANSDIVRSEMPLQLSVGYVVNGDTVRVEAAQLSAVGVTVEWESLDLEYSTDDFIEVDDNGLVMVMQGRKAGDSTQIVAHFEGRGRVATDTFTVYVDRHPLPGGGESVVGMVTGTSVLLRSEGLYLTGFEAPGWVTVYTVEGCAVVSVPASTDYVPYAFRPHTLYIIYTPKGVFKRRLRL